MRYSLPCANPFCTTPVEVHLYSSNKSGITLTYNHGTAKDVVTFTHDASDAAVGRVISSRIRSQLAYGRHEGYTACANFWGHIEVALREMGKQ